MQFAGDAAVNGLAMFDGQGWQRLGTFDGVVWDMVEFNSDLWVVGDFRTANAHQTIGVGVGFNSSSADNFLVVHN